MRGASRERADVGPHLLVDRLPVRKPLEGHHEPVPFYLTREMFGGVPVEVAGGEISQLVGRPVAGPHRHDVPEVYLLISPKPRDAVIDVFLDGERHEVASPAVFYVPAGRSHHFVTREAAPGSYCLGLLLGPSGSGPHT